MRTFVLSFGSLARLPFAAQGWAMALAEKLFNPSAAREKEETMKKTKRNIVVVAATLLMVACGGKTSTDNPQVAAGTDEPTAEVVELPSIKSNVENAKATLGLPEGWIQIVNEGDEGTSIDLAKAASREAMTGDEAGIHLEFGDAKGQTADEIFAALAEGAETKGDLQLDNLIYKVAKTAGEPTRYELVTVADGKMAYVALTGGAQPEDADVKAILNSLKLK